MVINVIKDCSIESPRLRRMDEIKYVIIHRFGSNDSEWYIENNIFEDAKGVANFYMTNPEAARATGAQMPYAFVSGRDGTIWQARKLTDVTPHARRFNHQAIGWAFLGDFRYDPPTMEQWETGLQLLSRILRTYPHLEVVGHSDLKGATSGGKRCPGRYFDVSKFEFEAWKKEKHLAEQKLMDFDVII